jgi:hypothetical protein
MGVKSRIDCVLCVIGFLLVFFIFYFIFIWHQVFGASLQLIPGVQLILGVHKALGKEFPASTPQLIQETNP